MRGWGRGRVRGWGPGRGRESLLDVVVLGMEGGAPCGWWGFLVLIIGSFSFLLESEMGLLCDSIGGLAGCVWVEGLEFDEGWWKREVGTCRVLEENWTNSWYLLYTREEFYYTMLVLFC